MQQRTVEEHLSGLRAAAAAFTSAAAAAGLETKVPTAPAWTVRALLAHQGMVHRWARAALRGEPSHPPSWNAEGKAVQDPVGWLSEGVEALVSTIEAVPDDVRAMVFLKDAPAPRLFWARRQCHETTIHAVDALAARLGRPPAAGETVIEDAVALDGIDEVLTGFITRGSSRFAGVGPVRVHVQPTGVDRGWSVLISDGTAVTTRVQSPAATGEVVLAGSPVALYLALWNRTTPDAVEDSAGFLETWRTRVRVRWSG